MTIPFTSRTYVTHQNLIVSTQLHYTTQFNWIQFIVYGVEYALSVINFIFCAKDIQDLKILL